MLCYMCEQPGTKAEHIAVTADGEPVVMCQWCYDKARIFFEEVRPHGKSRIGGSPEKSQQGLQS